MTPHRSTIDQIKEAVTQPPPDLVRAEVLDFIRSESGNGDVEVCTRLSKQIMDFTVMASRQLGLPPNDPKVWMALSVAQQAWLVASADSRLLPDIKLTVARMRLSLSRLYEAAIRTRVARGLERDRERLD